MKVFSRGWLEHRRHSQSGRLAAFGRVIAPVLPRLAASSSSRAKTSPRYRDNTVVEPRMSSLLWSCESQGWLTRKTRISLRLSCTISRESVCACVCVREREKEKTSFFSFCSKILEWRRVAEWCFIVGYFFFIKLFSILPPVHSVCDI